MKFRLGITLALLLSIASIANAQGQVGSLSRMSWEQGAPTIQDAQSYLYMYYADGNATGLFISGVSCVQANVEMTFTCSAPFPAFSPGTHTITLTARTEGMESDKSNVLTFRFIIVPVAPRLLRIG